MKRVLICNIPMKKEINKGVYSSSDASLPTSGEEFYYPVNSMFSQTLKSEEEIKVLLIVKKDINDYYKDNVKRFEDELNCVCESAGAKAEYVIIESDFSQDKDVHENLISDLVDEIEIGSKIVVDMTFGPKDLPVILFTVLGFAEKFLECEIDNIVYGKAEFVENKVVSQSICDMAPLFYLSSVANTIHCDNPEKAKGMLKNLLSL